jgi:hypothetical protein
MAAILQSRAASARERDKQYENVSQERARHRHRGVLRLPPVYFNWFACSGQNMTI